MQRSNEQTLGEVIKQLIETYKLKNGLTESQIIGVWEQTVGSLIARHTTNLKLKNKVLFVKLDNAAMRSELSFAKQKLVLALNQALKEEVVSEIVFS